MLEWRRGMKRLRPRPTTTDWYKSTRLAKATGRGARRSDPSRWGADDAVGLIKWRRVAWQTVAAGVLFLLVLGVSRSAWTPAKSAMVGVNYAIGADYDWLALYDRAKTIAAWRPLSEQPGGTTTTGGTGTTPDTSKISLRAPLSGSVTLAFGQQNDGGVQRFHTGLDIAAPENTDILAAAAGTVKTVARNATYGLYVEIDHGSGLVTLYAHCNSAAVKAKDTVTAGQAIAKVGKSGNATGFHLHFEALVGGQAVDPAPLLAKK